MNIEHFIGKVFRKHNGEEFGIIRRLSNILPEKFRGTEITPFAEDESGNFFVIRGGAVYFWDHETSELDLLAGSIGAFTQGIATLEPVLLKPGQVKSVWVDPEFAKKFGIKQ